jgi:hypothetical protein
MRREALQSPGEQQISLLLADQQADVLNPLVFWDLRLNGTEGPALNAAIRTACEARQGIRTEYVLGNRPKRHGRSINITTRHRFAGNHRLKRVAGNGVGTRELVGHIEVNADQTGKNRSSAILAAHLRRLRHAVKGYEGCRVWLLPFSVSPFKMTALGWRNRVP